ncbi:hypothetical protein B1742_24820 [Enterobacter kobei]|nr:hypothetical protein B1742_24820 [Enterobacter kobei]
MPFTQRFALWFAGFWPVLTCEPSDLPKDKNAPGQTLAIREFDNGISDAGIQTRGIHFGIHQNGSWVVGACSG